MGGYELDTNKDALNRERHNVSLTTGLLVFRGVYIEMVDDRFDYGETRLVAIGPVAALSGRLYSVTYTWRGAKRRIISVRIASEPEAREYRRYHPGDD